MANISNQDRKKARVTFYVFAVIYAVFTLLTVLFGILTPRAIEVKALGEGERIRSQVETKDGTEYFLFADLRVNWCKHQSIGYAKAVPAFAT